MRKSIFFVILLMMQLNAMAQDKEYTYAKEKVYLHTNHVFFKPGEQVYFKIYLVNGKDQTASTTSNVVYVEVLNPSGNVIQKLSYKAENGYAEGSYDFGTEAVGGIYKLRAYTTWMRNENESMYFTKELTVQKLIAPRILMKLDFPQKGYGAGDEVTADFSMRSLDNAPIRDHQAKFAVSVAGVAVETGVFNTNHDGKYKLRFHLPAKLESSDGLLNITVQYDAFTESVSRSIPIVLNKIDLQFMPEGGYLIKHIPGMIAFRAVNEHGKPVDVKGNIIDSKGSIATSFESYHFGMGKFAFEPKAGEQYKAVITTPKNISQQFDLPAVHAEGVAMNISHDGRDIKIKLLSTLDAEVRLVAQTKTVTQFAEFYEIDKGSNEIVLSEALFPIGITQLTLYSAAGLPLAERLVFLNKEKQLQVKITTDKQQYLPREKVQLKISTTDETGKGVPSNLSLSVVDDKLWTFADDKQDHVLSWLLLGSELKGKIEEPPFYFKKDEPKADGALDLVMLTHGYRYFDYTEYVYRNGQLQFSPEVQSIVSGIVVNEKNEPMRSDVYLVNTYTGGKAQKLTTGSDGIFYFTDLKANNQYSVIAKSFSKKQQTNIRILQNGSGYNPFMKDAAKQLATNDKFFATVQPQGQQKLKKAEEVNLKIDLAQKNPGYNIMLNENAATIDEVVVTAYGTVRKMAFTGSEARVAAKQLAAVPLVKLDNALQGMVAGVMVTPAANPMQANINLRGFSTLTNNNTPLVVLNGVPVENYNLSFLNPNDIESVQILKDNAAAAIYGCRASNGVLIINSKKAAKERMSLDLNKPYMYAFQSFIANNIIYSPVRKFYAPVYESLQADERNDFRETIYWNPVVQTGMDGNATLEFYNSDATTTFRSIAEGIGYNGVPGRTEYTYAAAGALNADIKIPPYLTVGDKAMLPLVIKNNSQQTQHISVEVTLPGHFITEGKINDLQLAPGISQQVLIPLEATAAAKGDIRIAVKSELGKETFVLPVTAAEKGFPVVETISGDAASQYPFDVRGIVPGSLHGEFKVHTTVEGQLLDGIESMLREPYGCFEQTSSTTYPNVFVLKYLRESGKSNPAIEKKAMDYIEAGYKRLVGFETSENGFEWFGKAPAHEALTAYGLLEFTDMQDLIKVDKAMLERTKKFLLDKRDGNGGFRIKTGGYDQFASVPGKIAQVYIVYALTQAGLGKEIETEYKTAVAKAAESNDAYQLAMMALAAHNMKDMNSYEKLMSLLDKSYRDNGFAAETSVVNSRDASLRVESRSLYAMALMRNGKPDLVRTAALISSILKEKSYYGYGSTQSTVMALQAILAYSKLVGNANRNAQVRYAVNGRTIQKDEEINAVTREGKNVLSVEMKEAVPYSFQVSYNTFTPPNSEKAVLKLSTALSTEQAKMGETVRMNISVANTEDALQPMAVAKIGIPAGLSVQPWQLKELMEKNQVAYYEIFDNYLVFYWMGFAKSETKTIQLDLKADVPGKYKGKAGNVYLYYTPEHKNWNAGMEVEIMQ